MKRAKQRKRHYPYKWAGTFSYVDLDVYSELAKPVAEGICPACGKPYTWDSGCHKLLDGEIGKFDGLKIIHSEREKAVPVRKGKRHGK